MSGYLSRRSRIQNEHARREFERRVWDLYDEYRRNSIPDVCRHLGGPIQPDKYTLDGYLLEEAMRVLPNETNQCSGLAWSARPVAQWALNNTPEKNTRVAAAFAVQVIYDCVYRAQIRGYLYLNRPTQWWWTGYPEPRQHFEGAGDGFVPPMTSEEISLLQRSSTPEGENLWEPEWEMRRSYVRQMDCLRPPLLSVQIAADVIQKHLKMSNPKVLALECGHSEGPQALSIWLPQADVFTCSNIYDPNIRPPIPADGFDAVVVGIPTLRRLVYASVMVDADCYVNGKSLERFWARLPGKDTLKHVELLIKPAISNLKLGGVLVVIGAVEEGEHHSAIREIEKSGSFKQIIPGRPIQVAYQKIPWCPYWVLPPEDRLVSAFRRIR